MKFSEATVCTASLGCLNVEVTVTGQRGWVDEPAKTLAADMTFTGQIWFSPQREAEQSRQVALERVRGQQSSVPT